MTLQQQQWQAAAMVVGEPQWLDAGIERKMRGLAMYYYQMVGAADGVCCHAYADKQGLLVACRAVTQDLGQAASFDEITQTAAGALYTARRMASRGLAMEDAIVAHPYIPREIYNEVYDIDDACSSF